MRTRSHPDRPVSRLSVAALAMSAALGAALLVAPPAHAATTDVQILATNDFHGRLLANGAEAGAAVLAGAVKQLRAQNPNTVFAAAGDLIGASTFESFIQRDKPTIDALNEAGLEVSAVGNHELDAGYRDLVDRVMAPYDAATNPLGGAEWEYIAANLKVRATGEPAVPTTWIKEFGDVQVGFVGAVTEELPALVSPAGIADIEVTDIVESVNAEAAALTAEGADLVVMLVHEGAPSVACETMDDSGVFAEIVNGVSPDVDAIVSGHTHLAYNCEFPVAEWAADGRAVTTRPVVSAGQYGTNLNQLVYTVDGATGEVSAKTQAILPLANSGYVADPTVTAIVNGAKAEADILGARRLGEITADFNRGLQPAAVTAQNPSGVAEARGAESTLGNFVADVQLWAAQRTVPDTQIAFMNPGGLRQDLKYAASGTEAAPGIVTYREAAGVQPFANTLVTMSLTGDQIRRVLEQQWQPATASRPFLKLGVSGGLTYTTDYAAAAGSRVQNLRFNGVPVDAASPYQVVVNSFLASGGDNFGVFAEGADKADSGQIDLQAMVDWFAEFGTATPDLAQRSIGVTLPPAAGPDGYAVGETFTLELSSLEFTTNEQPATTVDVAIAGKPAGSAAIVDALVAETDRAGTATVSVTVPAGVSGTVPLTITTPVGTSFEIPIQVAQPVVKVESRTYGWPGTLIARRGATIPYTVLVLADGVVPTGEVAVFDRGVRIATATLTEANDGIITVRLPGLSRGLHKLSAGYGGSATVEPSESRWLPVLIL